MLDCNLPTTYTFTDVPESQNGNSTASGGMKMQLVGQGQGGPQDLPQLLHYWVEQEACIPGFMASVSLECWEGNKNRNGQ